MATAPAIHRSLGSSDLLGQLCDANVDDSHTLMDQVTTACSIEAVAALSAVCRHHRELCRPRLQQLFEQYEQVEAARATELCERLGYYYPTATTQRQMLNIRALTIPDNLPEPLRPLLGKWLQADGHLGQVSCVRCRSWIRTGEIIGWVELEPVRAGEPERLTPEERLALDRLDTPDGLLKTVLKHAHRKVCKYDLEG